MVVSSDKRFTKSAWGSDFTLEVEDLLDRDQSSLELAITAKINFGIIVKAKALLCVQRQSWMKNGGLACSWYFFPVQSVLIGVDDQIGEVSIFCGVNVSLSLFYDCAKDGVWSGSWWSYCCWYEGVVVDMVMMCIFFGFWILLFWFNYC